MTALRHEFYESDERLTLSIFDKGADPEQVKVSFESRKFTYSHGDKTLALEPLKGQIDPSKSDYTVGKVKVEVRLAKAAHGRWGSLVGDSPDPLASAPVAAAPPSSAPRKPRKNWDGITSEILNAENEVSPDQDPNAGGDAAVNNFFQKLYADADDDTRRAMLKSYQESGGTTLSTNWDEVKKAPVDVKPPEGSEWKKWAV
ncbi:SGS-domain-containing protein [Fomes fomentarius]|nr:SGS-domain-containing protein [Fomes fomentarius]